jgi:hypothetical protein
MIQGMVPLAPASLRHIGHDREWWALESGRAGSDWPAVVDTALNLLVAGCILEPEPDDTMASWDVRSWREAAVDYHRDRPSAAEIEPERLRRLRRLMADDVSLDRAWHELRDSRPTPEVTIDAIKLAVRERGLRVLEDPLNQERLRRCDAGARARLDSWIAEFPGGNC